MNILMYHFINSSKDSKLFSGMNGFKSEEFENQLKYLLKSGIPLLEKDIKLAACNKRYPNDECFYLTFDDGFKQHFDNVYPILKDYGIQASFFVPTMAIETGKSPVVEKQRLLQYNLFSSYNEFLDIFCKLCQKFLDFENDYFFIPTSENIQKSSDYLKQFGFYSNEERYFRKIRNEILTFKQFEKIIDVMFRKFFPSDQQFINEFYMTSSDLKNMSDNGMIIGGHSYSHPFMNKITYQQVKKEIEHNISYLHKITNKKINSFAYPYGAFDDNVIKCIINADLDYAFDTRTEGCNSRYNIRRNDAAVYFKGEFKNYD